MKGIFRRSDPRRVPVEYEHPAQAIASAFLRALAADDAAGVWDRLSRESRGLLEGMHAARSGSALHEVAGTDAEHERVGDLVAPLRAAALGALGGPARVNAMGVSAARLADRTTAYVLLLPDFGEERIVSEDEWRPAHLIAFVHESREWLVDLATTRALSSEAGIADPLGPIR